MNQGATNRLLAAGLQKRDIEGPVVNMIVRRQAMSEKLENCSHCGSEPIEHQGYVYCRNGKCQIVSLSMPIAAWNKRFACNDSNGKPVFAGDDVQTKYLHGPLCYIASCLAWAVISVEGKIQWIFDMDDDDEITLIEDKP